MWQKGHVSTAACTNNTNDQLVLLCLELGCGCATGRGRGPETITPLLLTWTTKPFLSFSEKRLVMSILFKVSATEEKTPCFKWRKNSAGNHKLSPQQ
jgi:hypothetical protein